MKPDTKATRILWSHVYERRRSGGTSLGISANPYIVEGKGMSTGIRSAPRSLESGAFLQPRLGGLVGPEAMEGGRGEREPQTLPLTLPPPET